MRLSILYYISMSRFRYLTKQSTFNCGKYFLTRWLYISRHCVIFVIRMTDSTGHVGVARRSSPTSSLLSLPSFLLIRCKKQIIFSLATFHRVPRSNVPLSVNASIFRSAVERTLRSVTLARCIIVSLIASRKLRPRTYTMRISIRCVWSVNMEARVILVYDYWWW